MEYEDKYFLGGFVVGSLQGYVWCVTDWDFIPKVFVVFAIFIIGKIITVLING